MSTLTRDEVAKVILDTVPDIDPQTARHLARRFGGGVGLSVVRTPPPTNEVLAEVISRSSAEQINEALAERGWKLAYSPSAWPSKTLRLPDHEEIMSMNLGLEDRVARLERLMLTGER